jgi:hypothetical protein
MALTRRLLAASAAVALASGLIGTATVAPAEAATGSAVQIGVDLGTSTGPVKHGATGFLYGLGSDGVPSDTVLDGLSHLGVAAQMAPDGLQHPTGDALKVAPEWKRNGGGDIQIYMQDVYSSWPYQNLGLSDYLAKVDTIVGKVMADPYRDSYVYVPFNEPDWIWYSGNLAGLEAAWKTVYEEIRSRDPQARIAGPNYSTYNSAAYRGFLTFAKANDVLPDVVTWHELEDSTYTSWYAHYDDYRQIEADLGISPLPISINEYGRASGDLGVPGNLVQLVTRFETSKVDASLAYWQPAGDLDLLVTQNNRATGAWWLYHWYGLMSGDTVAVSLGDRNQPTQALATYDSATRQARILLGGSVDPAGTFDADLAITGLAGTPFSSGAHIAVWGVDSSGAAPSPGPYVVAESDLTASAGTLHLPLTALKGSSAYYAVLTPATSLAPVAAGRYEAEYARMAGTAAPQFGTGDGYAGTGYVAGYQGSSSADTAFFVDVPSNGFYDVTLRYSAGPVDAAPSTRSLRLSLNREPAMTLSLPGTADWSTWRSTTVRLYLPVGINRIDLAAHTADDDGDAVALDYLQLDAVTGTSATYEGESPANTLSGIAVVANDAAASGGKLIGFIGGGAANTLRFNDVSVPATGDYTLVLAYAQAEVANNNAFQIVDRFADVSVDGGPTTRVAFANTRSWSNFWTTSIRMRLTAGTHTVTIGNATAWAPNIDAITVARTAEASQTVTFDPVADHMFGDADFTVSATASSGLPVQIAATGPCTVVGDTVHLTGAGECILTASQPGNDDYDPAAPVTRSFTVAKATPAVSAPAVSAAWGTPATVEVSVASDAGPVGGRVTLTEGETDRGSADLSDGRATFAMPVGLAAGDHRVAVAYQGGDDFATVTAATTVTVTLPSTWNPTTAYTTGSTVNWSGQVYTALWYSRGERPGLNPAGAWQQIAMTEDGTVLWTASRVFTTGDEVSYQGKRFLAGWYTRNQEPGAVTGPWQEIAAAPDGTAIWTPTRIFNAGDTALYDGELFVARWYTRNQSPALPNGPWELAH